MSKSHINNPYRKIYKEHYGEIPEGYHIHHVDFNPHNNDPSNLVALAPEEHAKIHDHEGVSWCSVAGKEGGKAAYSRMNSQEKEEWHTKGGKTSKNPGGYRMKDVGKNNIREARLKSKKFKCTLCDSKIMDGGNMIKHIHITHNVPKENCYQWRASAKVDN
jgi:hypothetical protein